MNKEDRLKKLIAIYNPDFDAEMIRFIREDNASLIFHVHGTLKQAGVFNLYPASSIKSLVDGRTVKYYIVTITEENL